MDTSGRENMTDAKTYAATMQEAECGWVSEPMDPSSRALVTRRIEVTQRSKAWLPATVNMIIQPTQRTASLAFGQ